MTCECCNQDQTMDDIWRERTYTEFPTEYCSKCYLEMVLAEGDCNKCKAIVRHRVNNLIPLQRMATLRAKFIPRIICSCGGIIELRRIVNKEFLIKLYEQINIRKQVINKIMEEIEIG